MQTKLICGAWCLPRWKGTCYFLAFPSSYRRSNGSAMKSVISFTETCSGCSLVLHNLQGRGSLESCGHETRQAGAGRAFRPPEGSKARLEASTRREPLQALGEGPRRSSAWCCSLEAFFLSHLGRNTVFWQLICVYFFFSFGSVLRGNNDIR